MSCSDDYVKDVLAVIVHPFGVGLLVGLLLAHRKRINEPMVLVICGDGQALFVCL